MSKQKPPKLEECPHVFIVEGNSDMHFYLAVLEHLGRRPGVFFQIFDGKAAIQDRNTLGTFINEKLLAEKASIGILIDADDDAAATTQSVKNHLKAIAGREVDEGSWQEQNGAARLGFFVAPDGEHPGEVETLAWNAFPDAEPHRAMKRAVGEHLEKMKFLGWEARSADKGRNGAYLCAASDEDPRLGPGAREGKFDFAAMGFARLRKFFEALPQSAQPHT